MTGAEKIGKLAVDLADAAILAKSKGDDMHAIFFATRQPNVSHWLSLWGGKFRPISTVLLNERQILMARWICPSCNKAACPGCELQELHEMSQRGSGYERKERDLYETPEWVTEALLPHLTDTGDIWEPAAGSGKMLFVLAKRAMVYASDISEGQDFLLFKERPAPGLFSIVTNPPYELAREFIEHALKLVRDINGTVAMLLRTDFDHANGRRHLFADHPAFAKKVVLTRRIVWFEGPKAAPSFNHAWFIWDWSNDTPPVLAYGPTVFDVPA